VARRGERAAGRSLRRRVAVRRPRKTLLIFCEGVRTEPEYLDALQRHPAVREVAAVELRVDAGSGGKVPRTLVAAAAEARARATEEDGEIDEVWCLFDVEWPRNHPHLAAAVERAREAGVRLAVSNPCFELWLILHFQDHETWLDTAGAASLRHRLDGSRDKGLDAATYMPLIAEAAGRAARLEDVHREQGSPFPRDNPSSGMHHLIASVHRPGEGDPEPRQPPVVWGGPGT
jgi:hypothetical protein